VSNLFHSEYLGKSLISNSFERRIYIPLPGPDARRQMFEIHIGNTPCQLEPKDYRTLAGRTDGYSGSDISIVVRDALMQPVRKVINATHFRQVVVEDLESGLPQSKWTPCSPGAQGAKEMAWSDIGSDELLEPPLKLADFLKSLESTRPTVTEVDIKKHEDWTRESGAFSSYVFHCTYWMYRKRWRIAHSYGFFGFYSISGLIPFIFCLHSVALKYHMFPDPSDNDNGSYPLLSRDADCKPLGGIFRGTAYSKSRNSYGKNDIWK